MKILTTTFLLLSAGVLFAQIKFSEKAFDNGMRYPIAHFSSNPTVADSMNAEIQRHLMDAEVSDFCIGDYGFFQKGNHLELHLICNCIDFAETDHKYLFFSLETGSLVGYVDLFATKERAAAIEYINSCVRKAGKADFGESRPELTWSDISFRLYKDGLQVYLTPDFNEDPVEIPWTELSTYLKFSFL